MQEALYLLDINTKQYKYSDELLKEGENSGMPLPYDSLSFKDSMHKKHL
jgi:hypothetical protein